MRQVSDRQETYRAVSSIYALRPVSPRLKFASPPPVRYGCLQRTGTHRTASEQAMTRIFKIADESAILRVLRVMVLASATVAAMPLASVAEPRHAIAMVGEPALPDGFTALPYVNPDAPKGGTIRLAEPGSFDSLKPWVLKGSPAWSVGVHVAEPLMLHKGLPARAARERAIELMARVGIPEPARRADSFPLLFQPPPVPRSGMADRWGMKLPIQINRI